MPKQAQTPVDYSWFRNQSKLSTSLAQVQLTNYSIEKIVLNKLSSKNFKKGLVFDNYVSCAFHYNRLIALITKKIEAEMPYLTNSTIFAPLIPFIITSSYGSSRIKKSLCISRSESVRRYLTNINTQMYREGLPLAIDFTGNTTEGVTYYKVSLFMTGTRHYLHYRTLDYIPQIIQVLKTLSRKALFQDENIRLINSYQP